MFRHLRLFIYANHDYLKEIKFKAQLGINIEDFKFKHYSISKINSEKFTISWDRGRCMNIVPWKDI